MKLKTFTKGIASVVTIVPRKREPVKFIQQMPLVTRKRTDREAIWGDFCTVGDDLRKARKRYDETENPLR
ncbi:hypothetical protein [Halomonas salifodinae]|uniref:hypothetical protein n=1 Tax=Halomonas salifodinae TaxID=438745 RepID=UPI0033A1F6A0